MLETSVDLRGSQAWSQFDDAMTQFGGPGGAEAQIHHEPAHDDDVVHQLAADSDEEPSDSGPFLGRMHTVPRRTAENMHSDVEVKPA